MKIVAETCADAHEAAFDAIVNSHSELDIRTHVDKKEFTLEFLSQEQGDDFLHIKILHPEQEPQVSPGSNFGPLFTEAYKKQFLTLTSPRADGKQAVYTYWNRSKDYPHYDDASDETYDATDGDVTGEWVGDGDGRGYDQVSVLIDKLARDPNNRRGVIVTWNPLLDAESLEPPCMDFIQFIIRDNYLHMRVVFRSQDILLGLPENMPGCAAFFRYVLQGLWIKQPSVRDRDMIRMGTLTIISLTPHIYKKRDGNDFDKMRQHIFAKKTLGQWKVIIKE
ncbi:thymidylate synthase [Methanoregula sp.]|uniref:thymidylate synthase n=1 Tax=Methanoregula sp. TaxID=2052170 RepID=UPI0025D1918D|nr:thymidylate synthase [Methanoregula sp.]